MLIYKATNLINGKIYIGMTTKIFDHPIKVHKRDSQRLNTYFYQAIRKHGFDNFKWEVIDTAETMEELEEKERYDIKLYNCFDNKDVGYNTQSGGNSLYEITEEHRRQRSERAKGKNNPMYGTVSPMKGKNLPKAINTSITSTMLVCLSSFSIVAANFASLSPKPLAASGSSLVFTASIILSTVRSSLLTSSGRVIFCAARCSDQLPVFTHFVTV